MNKLNINDAKTPGDLAAFLIGAGIGGGLDATLNVAGFAEPWVFAGIVGSGALGFKQLVWDSLKGRKAAINMDAENNKKMEIEQLRSLHRYLEDKSEFVKATEVAEKINILSLDKIDPEFLKKLEFNPCI